MMPRDLELLEDENVIDDNPNVLANGIKYNEAAFYYCLLSARHFLYFLSFSVLLLVSLRFIVLN